MEPVIFLRSLNKTFESDDVLTAALSNVTLTVNEGEYIAISGPSGCGKSSLLSVLGLLDSHDSGTYEFRGQDVGVLTSRRRAEIRCSDIGFIFQSFNLIGDLTIRENVALPLKYSGATSQAVAFRRANDVLERLGMSHRAAHFPHQLSGGQQQRAAIARAIVSKPSVILADEPTGNLDSKNGEAVMDLLSELHADGSTICVVTHDPQHANRATRRVSMLDGQIVSS